MDIIVSFLTGAVVTLFEVLSKYRRAPREAVFNPWAYALLLVNGLASVGVYLLVRDTQAITLYVTNVYAKAVLIGIGWQTILRSKIFTLVDPDKGKDTQIGIEHFYKRCTAVFENQIEMIEEKRVLAAIRELLKTKGLSDKRIRSIAGKFIDYKCSRKKITKTEADELRTFIDKNGAENILYLVFDMSSLSTLRDLYSSI